MLETLLKSQKAIRDWTSKSFVGETQIHNEAIKKQDGEKNQMEEPIQDEPVERFNFDATENQIWSEVEELESNVPEPEYLGDMTYTSTCCTDADRRPRKSNWFDD